MLKLRYLIIIAIVMAVTAATGMSMKFKPDQEVTNIPSHQTNATFVSVWDKQQEQYTGNPKMTVYRSPSCGCCGIWIEHAQKHGFEITDIQTDDMEAIKQKHNIPAELASCHTAIIDGYVIEGHIPADDIKRFLRKKPNWKGLTVPAMPLGTPGMEAGEIKQPFEVLAFNDQGKVEVFNNYENY